MELDLPYIQHYRDRHGRHRYYYRRKGCNRAPLPPPSSPKFLDAYHTASAAVQATRPRLETPSKGTVGALVLDYRASADFSELAKSTKKEMGYVLDWLYEKHGAKRLSHLERRHILDWKDKLASKPGAANKMLRTIKQLMTFAVDRGYRSDNPALKIKMMKLGRWRAWTDTELAQFEARWPLGTLERTGFALALYTGQRRADLAKLKWSSITSGEFRLKQSKGKVDLVIPLHPLLNKALNAVEPKLPCAILTGARKSALNEIYFGSIMAGAIEAAGLPDDCVLHGLRKTTGRLLAECGAKVAPITGHRTERMVTEYTRDADQARLARASVKKWASGLS